MKTYHISFMGREKNEKDLYKPFARFTETVQADTELGAKQSLWKKYQFFHSPRIYEVN